MKTGLTLSMLFTGTWDVWSLSGSAPPEPFLGLLAPEPPVGTSGLPPTPANDGCCCCGCCRGECCWGSWSRGRPGVGDIPPWAGTLVGDWLFWIWLDKTMDEKLLMLPPQLLLFPRALAPPLLASPPRMVAGTLLFFDWWTLRYGLKWAELDCEWLLPLLSLLVEPRPLGRGGWVWTESRAARLSPGWQSLPQTWK